jgi:hypothetical protein
LRAVLREVGVGARRPSLRKVGTDVVSRRHHMW